MLISLPFLNQFLRGFHQNFQLLELYKVIGHRLLPDSLRDPTLSFDSFLRDFETLLFWVY